MEPKTVTFTINLSEDDIKPGDYFFFYQHDGTPTVRQAKADEDVNGFTNSKTGETPYWKIESIEGVLISPKMLHGNLICK